MTKRLEKIVAIRNRVMHIRPLNFDDITIVTEFCREVVAIDSGIEWKSLKKTLNMLENDASYVLSLEIMSYDDEDSSISHNLPIPDFDETGLIGRDADVNQILQLCSGAFPVISIVGEGGVGKSALALKVAYELIEKKDLFDAVVWVTSKTSQITLNEIKEIKGAIDTSFGIIHEIGKNVVGESFNENGLDEIIEYLATFKIALFIDNLETILDDNIKKFVGSLPQGSKIIITSRIGLGAYEVPIKLQGIEEKYASQLLRSVAKSRSARELYSLEEKVLRSYVNRMHRNPSYIKWFVSSVQTGLTPEAVLQNSNSFLEFCMSNVYNYLSEDAQQLTKSLQCSPGLKDMPELSYLNDFQSIRSLKAIQELMSTNMLSQSSSTKHASVKTSYQLSELARAYLSKHHRPSKAFQDKIKHKRNQLNSTFEQQNSRTRVSKYIATNIKHRDKSDRVIIKKLTEIQGFIARAEYDKAFELLEEAQRLAPDYFEVARFMAYFYQKIGNFTDAREQYELSIILSPSSSQLYYWFGKFLLYSEENVDEAVVQFEKAKDLDPNAIEVSLSLARGYLFQQRFEEAQAILDGINDSMHNAGEHMLKMYHDTGIQIQYRTADNSSIENDFNRSIVALEKMRFKFDKLSEKYKDRHMRGKLTKCNHCLSRFMKCEDVEIRNRARTIQAWVDEQCVK